MRLSPWLRSISFPPAWVKRRIEAAGPGGVYLTRSAGSAAGRILPIGILPGTGCLIVPVVDSTIVPGFGGRRCHNCADDDAKDSQRARYLRGYSHRFLPQSF